MACASKASYVPITWTCFSLAGASNALLRCFPSNNVTVSFYCFIAEAAMAFEHVMLTNEIKAAKVAGTHPNRVKIIAQCTHEGMEVKGLYFPVINKT